MKNKISTIWLGELSYESSRKFIRERLHPLSSKGTNFLVFCYHPPTLTFGKNMIVPDKIAIENSFADFDEAVDFISTDRGGKATFHDQNQLMIYPVFNLAGIGLGIKPFIKIFLTALVLGLKESGVESYLDEDLVGIWIDRDQPKKLASVGFRVINKCTDHGVSLNVGKVSQAFSRFSPCGARELKLISIQEIINKNIAPEELVLALSRSVRTFFCESSSS